MKTELCSVPEFPGYYAIPGFTRYAVSPKGEVINTKTKELLQGSRNPAGYQNFRLVGDNGNTLTLGRHRIMALTFLSLDVDPSGLVVNHLDGVKGNDWVENLEWTTHQGNIEHAGVSGLTEKCQPIATRDPRSGQITRYPSIVSCARKLGLSKDAVIYRLRCGEERVFPEGLQYRPATLDTEWKVPDNIEISQEIHGVAKPVLVKDVKTGIVTEYAKLSDVADEYFVMPSVVTSWLKSKDQLVPSREIQIKLKADLKPWIVIDDIDKTISERLLRKCVLVTRVDTDQTWTYPSATACARAMGITTTALHYRLHAGKGKVYSDGCTYSYLQ